MARRNRKTIKDVYEGHRASEQERQDLLRQLARDELQAAQERDAERAREIVEEHKERRPAPPKRDKYGNLRQKPANDTADEPAGSTEAWLEYERALAGYETRRRQFAVMGLTLREGPPSPPKEGDPREQMTDAERYRRAQLGIPPKVPGRGRPPWA